MGGPQTVTMRLSCTVMEIRHGRTDGRSGDFILCPMLCIALDRQKQLFTTHLQLLGAFCIIFVSVHAAACTSEWPDAALYSLYCVFAYYHHLV